MVIYPSTGTKWDWHIYLTEMRWRDIRRYRSARSTS